MMMNTYYGVPFRVNGTGPRMRLLIGASAELGEEPIPRMELGVGELRTDWRTIPIKDTLEPN